MSEHYYTEPARLEPHKRGESRAYVLPPAADLAERIRDGESLATVAADHGISAEALRRRLNKSGWDADGQKVGLHLDEVMCGWCGCRTRGSGVCINCRSIEARSKDGYKAKHGLLGGEWVTRGAIKIWVPRSGPQVASTDFDPTATACFRCGATVIETCRTKSGERTKDHEGRLPRVCACGNELDWKGRSCEECQRKRRAKYDRTRTVAA